MKTIVLKLRPGVVIAFTVLLVGCSGVQKDYADADRLTYEALAPSVEAHAATLPGDDKARELRTLATWKLRWTKALEK